jgi:AcrR family transcriptional regulator
MPRTAGSTQTAERLLAAATELFARRGFAATSIREIAERAGANVAAGHYHYGSKRGLYRQVLRRQFARVRATLERRGATRSQPALRTASRPELSRLLGARVTAMLEVLLGPPPGPHGALLLREMADPTAALPIIVDEFIAPQMREMEAVVRLLAPGLGPTEVRWTVWSIVAQAIFYRFTMPATLLLLGRTSYPRTFGRAIARHITAFSLGGLERIVTTSERPGPRRTARSGAPGAPRRIARAEARGAARRIARAGARRAR